jgi:HK97 family phage prohead protease
MASNVIEYRQIDLSNLSAVETRAEDGSVKRKVEGYAARFEALSVDLGGYKEKIQRGAFVDSIEKNDVLMLWSHRTDQPLGRVSNKQLEIREDEKGLFFSFSFGDDYLSDYVFKAIKNRTVQGMSFGFRTLKDRWEINEQKEYIRTLESAYLIEISPTVFPAYPQTAVDARSAAEVLAEGIKNLDRGRLTFQQRIEARRRWLHLKGSC